MRPQLVQKVAEGKTSYELSWKVKVMISIYIYGGMDVFSKSKAKTRKNEKRNVTKSKKIEELREVSPTNNFLVGNYGLRRAERSEDMPSMSSEVAKI